MVDVTAHAHEPKVCTMLDIAKIEGDSEEVATFVEECNEYLKIFAAPVRNEENELVCFHCGTVMDAFKQMMGMGAAYLWGMVHGEATCSECYWPARGMHYPKDAKGGELFTARNLFLAYLPDNVDALSKSS